MRQMHQALVSGNADSLRMFTSPDLTYGHSNGWVETQQQMLDNLHTGIIDYSSFAEDSMHVVISGKQAHIRFFAEIGATLNGKTSIYRLRVLEVWIKDGKSWKLYARQAVRIA